MVRPAFIKLGGSVLTDKSREETLRRSQARRLLGEIGRSDVPTVLFHGAGSFGHPAATRAGFADGGVRDTKRVTETLASAGKLHAEIVALAEVAGLHPVSVPLHLRVTCEGGALTGVPSGTIAQLLEDGCTPVISGTIIRDDHWGWRVASADEWMEALATDISPRLALFVTDVDGVYDKDPADPEAQLLPTVRAAHEAGKGGGNGADVTGRMDGKLHRALGLAATCPVLMINGTSRGRLADVLKGKSVVSTRIETA